MDLGAWQRGRGSCRIPRQDEGGMSRKTPGVMEGPGFDGVGCKVHGVDFTMSSLSSHYSRYFFGFLFHTDRL